MTNTSGAAFFDLDRTLLRGASGEVFSHAMQASGLSSRSMPGERFMFGLFNAIGETLPTMALARQAVTLAKGRSQDAVRAAADSVADQLVAMVQPFAESAFAVHRAAGRPIVLATTTPYDLVKPFADRLGLDDVVATRYSVDSSGRYDGTLTGPFVWSAGKLAAVAEWAERNGVDLAESYAYSDSVYDTPLLSAVGHPVVVNPDARMVLVAASRRWPTLNLDVSPGVLKIPVIGLEVQQVAMRFARPAAYPYARFDIAGIENIPRRGAAILVGNHRSYFDVAAMSLAIAKSGRPARFLGKKEVFDAPIVGQIASAMGGIRVDRGTGFERAAPGGRRRTRRRRDGGDHAGGHDPTRPGVLQEAGRPVGCGPVGADDRCPDHPGRVVGHREGVAAIGPTAQRVEPDEPTDRAGTRRRADHVGRQVARRRHEADHEGARRLAPPRRVHLAQADGRGAGAHVSARLQGRPGEGSEAAPGHRRLSPPVPLVLRRDVAPPGRDDV